MTTQARFRGTPIRFLASAAALALGLLMSFFVAEVFVVLVEGEQVKFPRRVVEAPWGLRYNEPGARYRHKSADMTTYFQINGQGMRSDQDYSYEKPAGTKRIIFLGDSFTIGYEVDHEDSFPSILGQRLLAEGIRVEVLNAGVSGFSTAEEVLYLERELIKYAPDLVIINFFGNDLVDNVRTNLFVLSDGRLAEKKQRYVPAGRLGNFLNSNWLFNGLSEYSNAFAFVKERATRLAKARMVADNQANIERAGESEFLNSEQEPDNAALDDTARSDYQKLLAAALVERLYTFTNERGIPLIIQSIPTGGFRSQPMVDLFPIEYFDVERPNLYFLSSKRVLEPHLEEQQLVWERSHFHWTPFSHRKVGESLAEIVLREGYLD